MGTYYAGQVSAGQPSGVGYLRLSPEIDIQRAIITNKALAAFVVALKIGRAGGKLIRSPGWRNFYNWIGRPFGLHMGRRYTFTQATNNLMRVRNFELARGITTQEVIALVMTVVGSAYLLYEVGSDFWTGQQRARQLAQGVLGKVMEQFEDDQTLVEMKTQVADALDRGWMQGASPFMGSGVWFERH